MGWQPKRFAKKKQQTGSGLLGGIASPARILRAYHGIVRGKQRLNNAGWEARFGGRKSLKASSKESQTGRWCCRCLVSGKRNPALGLRNEKEKTARWCETKNKRKNNQKTTAQTTTERRGDIEKNTSTGKPYKHVDLISTCQNKQKLNMGKPFCKKKCRSKHRRKRCSRPTQRGRQPPHSQNIGTRPQRTPGQVIEPTSENKLDGQKIGTRRRGTGSSFGRFWLCRLQSQGKTKTTRRKTTKKTERQWNLVRSRQPSQ